MSALEPNFWRVWYGVKVWREGVGYFLHEGGKKAFEAGPWSDEGSARVLELLLSWREVNTGGNRGFEAAAFVAPYMCDTRADVVEWIETGMIPKKCLAMIEETNPDGWKE